MGQKKTVKLEDIANELGISIVSVSNALKGKKGVSEKRRKEVWEKAQEMGYELPQSRARKLEKSYRIGVMIAERYVKEYPSFYMQIYQNVAQVLTKNGCISVLEIVPLEREKMESESIPFENMKVDGILIIGEMNSEFIDAIRTQGNVAMVCVDFYNSDSETDYIVSDGFRGMTLLTEKLIKMGHQEIGFIGTAAATNSIMDRYMGYCKALSKYGIPEKKEWVIADREESGYGYELDFELPEKLPTAFVCNCDKDAYLLIPKLNQKGLRVPEDISVVGFDYLYPEGENGIDLTTYESDKRAMAQIGVNTLLKRMEGKGHPEGVRIVEGRVIEGNTVRNLNTKQM